MEEELKKLRDKWKEAKDKPYLRAIIERQALILKRKTKPATSKDVQEIFGDIMK